MHIYLDESGDTGGAPGFAVAMFFTKDPTFWEKIIRVIRNEEKYPYEFKFKKMQDNLRDGRVRFARKLAKLIDDRIYIWPWEPKKRY